MVQAPSRESETIVGAPLRFVGEQSADKASTRLYDHSVARIAGDVRPADARAAMVEGLRFNGAVQTGAVEAALSVVPRHLFVDGVSVAAAYADIAVTVKTTHAGVAISSASQPSIVAVMLELSELEPGQRVLEIGTGTGYNAALVASIVGPQGRVVTVELEDDLAVAARDRLVEHDFDHVEVVTGDGAAGHSQGAPYDRVIVTTGAAGIAEAWVDQVREAGRLVVPVVNSSGVGMVRCLVKEGTGLKKVTAVPCRFLLMRTPPGE